MKTHLWLAILAVLCPFMLIGQFSTQNAAFCQGAPRILCNTSLSGQSNAFGTDMIDTYECGGFNPFTGYNGNERIFRLEVNIRMEYDIRLSGVSDPELDFDLFLMREGCVSGDCFEVSQNNSNAPERIQAILNPGTFYIIVDTWEGEIGTFDISVDCNLAPPPVLCEPAEILWCNDIVSGNTWGGTSNFNADLYDCYNGTGTFNGPDIIYRFTKNRSSDNLRLFLFTETPNLNIFLINQCDVNGFNCALAGEPFDGGRFIDEQDLGLPAGEYYVIVDGRNSGTDGEFSLLLECDPFDFSGADELICGQPLENQSFAGGTDERTLYGCEGGIPAPFNGPERSYFFNVVGLTDITIQLDRTSRSGDLGLFLFQEGRRTPVCIEASIGDDRSLTINRTLPTGRYYVVVDSRKEAFFDLSVFGCACPVDGVLSCDQPIRASNAGGEDDVRFVGGDCFANLRVDAQDRVYEFTAPDSGMYRFSLTEEEDLGIFIFEDCQRPSTCLGFSNNKGDEDAVELVLRDNQTVFIAVDGIARLVTSTFLLSVTCNLILDSDDDGVIDSLDNCPNTPNGDQTDSDNDGAGDVCDNDDDNDGVIDTEDCDRLDPTINFSVGDICDDGDPMTINDVIRTTCACLGTPRVDTDGDGVFDDEDNCIDMPNPSQEDRDGDTVGDVCDNDIDNDGVINSLDCAPTDPNIALVIGDTCDDGDANTTDDRVSSDCVCAGTPVATSIQLFVGSATGSTGDVECVDIVATEFTNVATGSFSIAIDPTVAQVVEVNISENLQTGTFTGSTCAVGGANQAFVVWSAEPGTTLTLGPATPIAEVCYEFTSDEPATTAVLINDVCRSTEFFDINGDEIEFEASAGMLSNLGAMTGSCMAIGGTITDASRLGVAAVAVQLMDDEGEADFYMTEEDGIYELMATEGQSYEIVPSSMDDRRVGLSALDVLLFRQHFVFAKTFTHAHQFIAADIDGNGTLSIRDELLLTRMILGIYDGDAPVWKFVDANHEFVMPEDYSVSGPIFNYPSRVEIASLTQDMRQDFLAIRLGDLSVLDMTAYNRSTNARILEIQDQKVEKNERVTVPLRLLQELELTGLSLQLNYDSERLSLVDLEGLSSSLPIQFNLETPGVISIDWLETTAKYIDPSDEMLSLTFDVKSAGALSQMISLSSSRPNVIANGDGDIYRADIAFVLQDGQGEELAMTISPNPAIANILIDIYNVTQDQQIEVALYDMSGQILLQYERGLSPGQNIISIDPRSVDLIDGVYIVELKTNDTIIRDKVAYVR